MFGLTIAYLRDRALTTTLNILLLGLATATLVILLLFSTQLSERMSRDSVGIDLVIGAKGSPLQLILSSLYQIDSPTGNIPLEAKEMLEEQPSVAQAIPIALGDNFRGFRIVGSEQSYLDLYGAQIEQGQTFTKPSEVVIGADVARKLGMELGQRFVGSHGIGGQGGAKHDHAPLIVVGILAPTGMVIDRLIVTSVESVWDAHGIHYDGDHDHDHEHDHDKHEDDHAEHDHGDDHAKHDHGDEHAKHDHGDDHAKHDHEEEHAKHDHDDHASPSLKHETELKPEISGLLVKYSNAALGATRIPRMINRQSELQSAVPAVETARLLSLLGVGIDSVRLFAWLLALTGGLAIFIALLNAATAREGDLALLRVMGASKMTIFITIMLEGLITSAAGGLVGIAAGHIALGAASLHFDQLADMGISAWRFLPGELYLFLAVISIGLIAAVIPAIRIFRQDLADTLGKLT